MISLKKYEKYARSLILIARRSRRNVGLGRENIHRFNLLCLSYLEKGSCNLFKD
jgi:hypothetical protein